MGTPNIAEPGKTSHFSPLLNGFVSQEVTEDVRCLGPISNEDRVLKLEQTHKPFYRRDIVDFHLP